MARPQDGGGAERPNERKDDAEGEPQRRCILSGDSAPRSGLIRFVMSPDGQLTPDLAAKLPGRGIWMSADRALIEEGLKKGRLFKEASRSLKMRVGPEAVGDEFLPRLISLLERRVCDRLGLLRRSGLVVTGFEKCLAALDKSPSRAVAAVLAASDAGEDGIKKLEARLRHHKAGVGVRSQCLPRSALSQALGLENAVHLLIFSGSGTDWLTTDLNRLQGLHSLQG